MQKNPYNLRFSDTLIIHCWISKNFDSRSVDPRVPSNIDMSSCDSRALTPPARIPKGTFIVRQSIDLCDDALSTYSRLFTLADDWKGIAWGGVALAWIFLRYSSCGQDQSLSPTLC